MSQEVEAGRVEATPTDEADNGPNDSPPSYDSLYGRMKEARKSASGNVDFMKTMADLILGTIGCTIVLGFSVAIPVSMITIGSIYLHDCTAEQYIPIYLIVGGVFAIVHQLLTMVTQHRRNNKLSAEKEYAIDSLLTIFLLAWFIAGCIWIYRIHEPEYEDTTSSHYCHKTLYLFSFWLMNFVFILTALVLLFGCCCSLGSVALAD